RPHELLNKLRLQRKRQTPASTPAGRSLFPRLLNKRSRNQAQPLFPMVFFDPRGSILGGRSALLRLTLPTWLYRLMEKKECPSHRSFRKFILIFRRRGLISD